MAGDQHGVQRLAGGGATGDHGEGLDEGMPIRPSTERVVLALGEVG